MYTITSTKSLAQLVAALTPVYQTHSYLANLPFLRMVVYLPGNAQPTLPLALYNMSIDVLGNLLQNQDASVFDTINEYINLYYRTITGDWDLTSTWIPQFIADPTNPYHGLFTVTGGNPFNIDSTFVPFSDPAFMGLSPNLGYSLGLDTSGLQPLLLLDPDAFFPPATVTIYPKQVGDVRIQLEDNLRAINASALEISGAGAYDTASGLLHSCLRKPNPQALFSLSIVQRNQTPV